ncbi:hypothetical protein [Bacillus sp. SD088]|uniref:hypothetical protein n=1 Tax=Bacillus sp. SD088 TaxID=2782012 RepID=UPI001A96C5F7|nr:hypothetical protein [Bacillus sp. SD088]MBO0995630.1 hypothetical protein [Bacillus sp. SD088]
MIQVILYMREAGMSIELLLEYGKLVHQADETVPIREELLIERWKGLNSEVIALINYVLS